MNLLPIEIQSEYIIDTNAFIKKASIVVFSIFFLMFIGIGNYQLHAMEKEISQLQSEKNSLLEVTGKLPGLQQELNQLEQQSKEILEVQLQPVGLSQLLQDIQRVTPKEIWYTQIELSANNGDETQLSAEGQEQISGQEANASKPVNKATMLSIHGYSQSVNSVGSLTYHLNQLSYTNQMKVINSSEIIVDGVTIVEFHIEGKIKE